MVVSGAYAFIGTIKFKGWGKSIAAGINSYFEDLDWETVGLTFDKAVNGILDTLLEALQGTHWQKVGEDISTALSKIDWNSKLRKIGSIIWEAIKAAITTALEIAKKNPDIIIDLGAILLFKVVTTAALRAGAVSISSALATALSGLTGAALSPLGLAIAGIVAVGIDTIGA